MCTGAEMLMMVGTVTQTVGALQRGRQEQAMYDYQARQAEADARVERELGEVRAAKIRKAGSRQQAEAVAALAASGVDVNSGTALKIQQQITRDAAEDAQTALLSGNYRGARLESEAGAMRTAGRNARTASFGTAASSLMAGASRIKGGWRVSPEVEAYRGTWTSAGPFDPNTYDKQIYD